ncbi:MULTISPECIES: LolA family protein [Salinibaculum]|uniref:LolA family protein n=1 Tax=Salinibaculum TaxID=2732368 RepID=UPI0030CD20AD
MTDVRGRLDRWGPLVLVVLLVAATGAVGAVVLGPPSGDAILDNVEQRYESAETVLGAATVTVENETMERTASVEYVAADGNNSRVTVTDADGRTVVVGSNGSVAWTYQPATGLTQTFDDETRVEELKARYDGRYADRMDRFTENVTVERTGTETVDGEAAYVLSIESENESITSTATLWVDRDDWTVLQSRVTSEKGTVTTQFTDTRFDVSVDESTFRAPDETGQLVDGADRERYDDFDAAQSATDLALPDLRDSYTFEGALVASYDGTATATAIYGTDAGTVYVGVTTGDEFAGAGDAEGGETVTIAGQDVTVASTQGGSIAYWTDDGTTTAVVTRGPPETAREVAETVLGA